MPEAIREGDIPGVQLRRRQRLALPREEAWTWLAEPAKLARWLADEAEVEAGPAGALLLRGSSPRVDPPPAPWRERGRTVEIAPPELWVLAFERLDAGWTAATRLTLRLSSLPGMAGVPGGSELDVLQHGFQRLPLSLGLTIWESYRIRWRTALARLAAVTAMTEKPPSP
ncbi:MAG TPA: SRPBCC domain-containing protein [Thermoanaerobaculia bacterium]|nr:SRPBCC domain-containing protein [Thermoanaerobaculia bacterium]